MRGLTREHLVDIVARFEPCPENLQHMVLGIDGGWILLIQYIMKEIYVHFAT